MILTTNSKVLKSTHNDSKPIYSFYKSIQTGILREGEAIASVWVINWKYQIKTASLSLQETSENSDTVSANQVFGKQSFEDNSIFV